MHGFICCVLFCLLALSIHAAVDSQLYVSFDMMPRAEHGGLGAVTGLTAENAEPVGACAELMCWKKPVKKIHRALGVEDLMLPGISGKCFQTGRDSQGRIVGLLYRLTPSFSSQEGTLSFWVKPIDWNGVGGDKSYHSFVGFGNNSGEQLFTYVTPAEEVAVYIGGPDGTHAYAQHPATAFKKGAWVHVGTTWTANAVELYINGKLCSVKPRRNRRTETFQRMFLGLYWGYKNPGSTCIDELRYFSKRLSVKEMKEEYDRLSVRCADSRELFMRVGPKTPVLDGKIGAWEYSASVSGMRAGPGGGNFYSSNQSLCYFSYDSETFYVAMRSPSDDSLVANETIRDGKLWEDDSVELHVRFGDEDKRQYQFIFNPKKVIFDSRNGKTTWDARGLQLESSMDGGQWILEAAIPWENFGITPQVGEEIRFNFCRNFPRRSQGTQLAPARPGYADPRFLGTLVLGDGDVPNYAVSDFGPLYNASFSCKIESLSKKAGSLHLSALAKAMLKSFSHESTLTLLPNESASETISRNYIPESSTLEFSLKTDTGLTLYRTMIDYRNLTPVKLSYLYTDIPKKKLMFVLLNNYLGGPSNKLQVTFKHQEKQKLQCKIPLCTDKVVVEAACDIAQLPPALYKVMYTISTPEGKVLVNDYEMLEIFDRAPWDGIRDGLDDEVPAPWTALRYDKHSFDCWGRTYKLGGEGIFTSLKSAGHELLSRPVALVLDGRRVPMAVSLLKRRNADAQYLLVPQDGTKGLKLLARPDFTGVFWFDLIIDEGVTLDRLVLEVPLKREWVDGFDDCADFFVKTSLRHVGDKHDFFVNSVERPFFWIGSDDVGLMGGSGRKHGYYLKDKPHSLSVDVRKSEVLLRMMFVDTRLTVKKPRRLEFYLQATPVKPLNTIPMTWRDRKDYVISGEGYQYWESGRPEHECDFWKWILHRVQQDKRTPLEKMRYFSYYAPKGVSPVSPEWHYYGKYWICPPPAMGSYYGSPWKHAEPQKNRQLRDQGMWAYGCLNSRSFLDYKIYGVRNRLLRQDMKVKHSYYDLSWPRQCSNASHGCLWTDEFGDVMRDTDLRALHEFNMRVYRMHKAKNADALFMEHTYLSRTPSDSFFDIILSGEMFDSKVLIKHSYYDILTPELMRIAYATRACDTVVGLNWQLQRALEQFAPDKLKEYDPSKPETDRAVRHYMAYHLLYRCVLAYEALDRHQRLLPNNRHDQLDVPMRRFGYGKHQFYGCWQKNPKIHVAPDDERALASVMVNEGKAFVVVLNDMDIERRIEVSFDPEELMVTKTRGMGAFSGKKYVMQDKKISFRLPPRESEFVLLE